MRTIVLTADMMFQDELPPWEALWKVLTNRATIVETHPTFKVRSPTMEFEAPLVISMNRYVYRPETYEAVAVTNDVLFQRDNWTCGYCGRHKRDLKRGEILNRDHIIPQGQGGENTWENVVTSCSTCNGKKAMRTPKEAGMTLRITPRVVTSLEAKTWQKTRRMPS